MTDEYIFENGLRIVKPYYHDFETFVKKRWEGKKVIEMYLKEFPYYTKEYLEKAIEMGRITLNGKIIEKDSVLKKNKTLAHKTHRHELPVLDLKIEILFSDDKLIVIDKPPSLPLHPCGRYGRNSITYILEKEYNLKNLFPIHRLDRLTSGIVLIAKDKNVAKKYSEFIQEGKISKVYFAKVNGKFKEDLVICEEKIGIKDVRQGFWKVDNEQGKDSKTIFSMISYSQETNTSLVFCRPITGRTHQIRVHLQHLNFPISNDPLYGNSTVQDGGGITKPNEVISKDSDEPPKKKLKKNTEEIDELCKECLENKVDVDPESLLLYLHAWIYKSEKFEYKTNLPSWISDSKEKIEEKLKEFENKIDQ
eukprot:gene7213-11529_t